MRNSIYSILATFFTIIIIYFGGFFHGKKRTRELKEEIDTQKKINEEDNKHEKARENIQELYKDIREKLDNKYTFNSGVRPTPESGTLPSQKATLFGDSRKV